MKIKKPLALVLFILICQLAGIIGAFFTTPAIPTWYIKLNLPPFTPPPWLFAPVWTTLYFLMGISVYRIWVKKTNKTEKKFALGVFFFQLVLNTLWSIIFFGLKNPVLAFFEIVILWASIGYLIKLFWSIDKKSSYLLIPYFIWVSFASFLNLSIWSLNGNTNIAKSAFAQEFNYQKAYSDYVYQKDIYNSKLLEYNSKKDSYIKNPTLSLKEEFRLSLFSLLQSRNDLIKTYLASVRLKVIESKGLTSEESSNNAAILQNEYKWFEEYENSFLPNDTIETLFEKSKGEDQRIDKNTDTITNYTLINIGYSNLNELKNLHKKIYDGLKKEAEDIIKLNRADPKLFERWFNDIENEFDILNEYLKTIRENLPSVLSAKETYLQNKAYKNAGEGLEPSKESLVKINQYLYELENVVETKR